MKIVFIQTVDQHGRQSCRVESQSRAEGELSLAAILLVGGMKNLGKSVKIFLIRARLHIAFTHFHFSYMTPLMWRGLRRDLQQEDLHEHLPEDESRLLFEKLKRYSHLLSSH